MKTNLIGKSPAIESLMQMVNRLAATKTNVLIIGESGTGKELVARLIHEMGPLKNNPFIPVNCGAIPENLIESEMFGHKKGSFTGAVADKNGLFQAADRGTLFLDEVGELPLGMQVKLLRALQERTIRKVGGTDDVTVDVRIIAATNRDLEAAVAKGTFREDLYYRLNVILVRTPPLRERKSDIPILVDHFLKKVGKRLGKDMKGIETATLKVFQAYEWPGNVRELENVIERAVALEGSQKISVHSLPPAFQQKAKEVLSQQDLEEETPKTSKKSSAHSQWLKIEGNEIKLPYPDFSKGKVHLDKILNEVEKTYLLAALQTAGGVKKKAAEVLGITFRSIRYRLKKLKISSRD